METILIVSNPGNASTYAVLEKFLTKKRYLTTHFSKGREAMRWLKQNKTDLVLCARTLADGDGIDLLQKIKALDPAIQVILIAESGNIREAVNATRLGAQDYFTTPLYPDEMLATIKSVLERKDVRPEKVTETPYEFITGKSHQSFSLNKEVDLVAATDMTVIITGETGTGKEYVAREIHRRSNRGHRPFVAVDCGTLSTDLAGSELFGHTRGAFTGAVTDRKGCFEMADRGTLFLDEIGNLCYENQMKLLRVLQERQVRKLGGTEDVDVDVRMLVASNENLEEMVRNGKFREDVYYRLNEFEINMPPLRERPEDIEVFANYFLPEANEQLNKEINGFSDEVMQTLKQYRWPGNLRELKNTVRKMALRCNQHKIDLPLVPHNILFNHDDTASPRININLDNHMPESLNEVVVETEKQVIQDVLKRTAYNKTETARILDIDRKTLYNKMNAYEISY